MNLKRNLPAPPVRQKGPLRKWIRNSLLILVIWGILFFFLFGPGRLCIPSLLTGYNSVTDHRNTVYYSGDQIIKALDVLWMTSVAADSVTRFWGDTLNGVFDRGVIVFLCDSPDQYIHLTWNRGPGYSLLGRVVPDPDRSGSHETLFADLVNGMSRVYLQRRYGFIPATFLLPMWFREGCAGALQGYSPQTANLGKNLQQDPSLISLTDLRYPWSWQAMQRMDNRAMGEKGQGQATLFTRYLIGQYGIRSIRDYGDRLGWHLDPVARFAQTFHASLFTVESEWLEAMKASGKVPADVRFVEIPFSPVVLLAWMGILVAAAIPLGILIWAGMVLIARRKSLQTTTEMR